MKCNNSYEKQRKKRNKKCLQPERVPGIISVRPDTSDTGETALLPELATHPLYGGQIEISRLVFDSIGYNKAKSRQITGLSERREK